METTTLYLALDTIFANSILIAPGPNDNFDEAIRTVLYPSIEDALTVALNESRFEIEKQVCIYKAIVNNSIIHEPSKEECPNMDITHDKIVTDAVYLEAIGIIELKGYSLRYLNEGKNVGIPEIFEVWNEYTWIKRLQK